MEHTRAQEQAWGGLCEAVAAEIKSDYAVDGDIPHQLKIARRLEPIREVILNFAGEDLFIHYEEGQPQDLPQQVRVNEDGTLWELRTNSQIQVAQIASRIKQYLAA